MIIEVTKRDVIAVIIGVLLALLISHFIIESVIPALLVTHDCGCLLKDVAANGTCMKITCI
jgi:hypothetical protein